MSNCYRVAVLAFALSIPMLDGSPVAAYETDPAGTLASMAGIATSDLLPGQRVDPAIPTPEQHFGFALGSRPIRHAEAIAYFRLLADRSPRAQFHVYARTHEGRELIYLAVSDDATIANLDEFRQRHRDRFDPRAGVPSRTVADYATTKAVAWLAYGIHGDELSSVDAAAAVAYALVAGEGGPAEKFRNQLVVLIDPIENPDGRERYLAMTTAFAHKTPSSDPEDLSHSALWPWGRGNHYLFDLNRDWFSMAQPESARSAVIASWNPQLMVDSHEMGADSTYLFSPPRHPFNPFRPETHLKWGDLFGEDQAKGLDARGFDYFTREWNEEFFPGYGSSWASYRGAIGILYEMARTTGKQILRSDGVLRTFAQAVEHHTASSLANLTTLLENRAEILRDFAVDRRAFHDRARGGALAAYVLPKSRHPERTEALVALLRRQHIEVEYFAEAERAGLRNLRDLRTGATLSSADLPDAAWIVRTDQAAGPMVRVLMDPHVPMESGFLREQREYIERGKGSRLYDTTAWSLPLCYDIPAFWTAVSPTGTGENASISELSDSGSAAGGEAATVGRLLESGQGEPYAYAMDGTSDRSIDALADLMQQSVQVRVAERGFDIGGQTFGRGSLVVRTEGQPENIDNLPERMRDLASRHRVQVHALSTAKATAGPDLGGSHFLPLRAPRIGVWTGWPVSASDYGALWNLLDSMDVRFNALDLGRASQVDLRRYNVLILPDTNGGGEVYAAVFGKGGADRLREWVEAGGTAIGIGGGAAYLADEKLELTRTRLRTQALDRFPPVVLGPGAEAAEKAGRFRAVGLRAPAKEDDGSSDRGAEAKSGSKSGSKRNKKVSELSSNQTSPYDVAPMIGPGARPFVEGVDLGTPASMVPVNLADWILPALAPGQKEPKKEDLAAADARLRSFRPEGAFVRLELDPEMWLTWGAGEAMPALVGADDTLVADAPVQIPARFAAPEALHLGGLLWPEAAGRLSHTAYLTRESRERGQIVLFLNPPEYRGWTIGTRRLLLNAIFLGPGLGTRGPRPW